MVRVFGSSLHLFQTKGVREKLKARNFQNAMHFFHEWIERQQILWQRCRNRRLVKKDFQKYSQFVGNGTFVVVFEDFHLHVETARPKQQIPVCVLRHQFGVIAMFNFNLRNRLEDFRIILVVRENTVCYIWLYGHVHIPFHFKVPFLLIRTRMHTSQEWTEETDQWSRQISCC